MSIDREEAFVRGFLEGLDARVPEEDIPLSSYHFSYPESYFSLEEEFEKINKYHQKQISIEISGDPVASDLYDPEAHNLSRFMPADFAGKRDFLTGFFSGILVGKFIKNKK